MECYAIQRPIKATGEDLTISFLEQFINPEENVYFFRIDERLPKEEQAAKVLRVARGLLPPESKDVYPIYKVETDGKHTQTKIKLSDTESIGGRLGHVYQDKPIKLTKFRMISCFFSDKPQLVLPFDLQPKKISSVKKAVLKPIEKPEINTKPIEVAAALAATMPLSAKAPENVKVDQKAVVSEKVKIQERKKDSHKLAESAVKRMHDLRKAKESQKAKAKNGESKLQAEVKAVEDQPQAIAIEKKTIKPLKAESKLDLVSEQLEKENKVRISKASSSNKNKPQSKSDLKAKSKENTNKDIANKDKKDKTKNKPENNYSYFTKVSFGAVGVGALTAGGVWALGAFPIMAAAGFGALLAGATGLMGYLYNTWSAATDSNDHSLSIQECSSEGVRLEYLTSLLKAPRENTADMAGRRVLVNAITSYREVQESGIGHSAKKASVVNIETQREKRRNAL